MMLQSGLMMNDLQSALSYADYQENGLESIPMENKKAAEKEKIRSNDYYNELKKK